MGLKKETNRKLAKLKQKSAKARKLGPDEYYGDKNTRRGFHATNLKNKLTMKTQKQSWIQSLKKANSNNPKHGMLRSK